MQLPFFFEENLPVSDTFILSKESSKHAVQVLRMHESQQLLITNGKGQLLIVSIVNADKKGAEVKITKKEKIPFPNSKISIAISLIKNSGRFEWFLEKATEIGISEIIPLVCHRTEKKHFRPERMKGILVSAMLQSKQSWLPELKDPIEINDLMKLSANYEQRFIAYCNDAGRTTINESIDKNADSKIILIGPEGDFTKEEINTAIEKKYIPVSLGKSRLRTETAGLVAAVLLLNN